MVGLSVSHSTIGIYGVSGINVTVGILVLFEVLLGCVVTLVEVDLGALSRFGCCV